MAEKSGSDQSNSELRQRIAYSREALTRDVAGLQYELNFPLKIKQSSLKIKQSFQRNTAFWMGSALALGLLTALLRARTRKVYLSAAGKKMRLSNLALFESGALLGLLKVGIALAQPMVVNYFAKKGTRPYRS